MADPGERWCAVTSAGHVASVPRRRTPGTVLLSAVAALSVIGAGTAVHSVVESRRLAQTSTTASGDPVTRVSWGTVQVHQSEVVQGLSSAALGGMSHGVQNLVSEGKAQIAVTVTLHNDSGHVVPYDATAFRLRTGRGAPSGAATAPVGTSLNAGRLRDGGTVEGTVSFVTAADGSQLWLQLADTPGPVLVPLGTATAPTGSPEVGGPGAPAPGGSEHEH